jgi:Bacterial PH domain
MMRYTDHILQPGETVAYTTTLHWVVYLPAIGLWLLAFHCLDGGWRSWSGSHHWSHLSAHWSASVFPSAPGFGAGQRRFDVTNRRIVYKRGFIRRHTVEMNMDKVESVDVDQSILGRMLNYGDITIRGTGVGIEPLHNIDVPLEFRNQVTAR